MDLMYIGWIAALGLAAAACIRLLERLKGVGQ